VPVVTGGRIGELAEAGARFAASLTRLRIVAAQVEQIEQRLTAHATADSSCDCARCREDRLTLYGRLPCKPRSPEREDAVAATEARIVEVRLQLDERARQQSIANAQAKLHES
jgi:hypothetical protein